MKYSNKDIKSRWSLFVGLTPVNLCLLPTQFMCSIDSQNKFYFLIFSINKMACDKTTERWI